MDRLSRPVRLILSCLLGALGAGGLATLYVGLAPGPSPGTPSPELLAAGSVVALLTIGNLFVRFTRWQFLLRRLHARIPTVDSLAAFAGSFAFLPVPLLLGQLVARRGLLPEKLRPARSIHVLAFVWERLFDLWALLIFSAAGLGGWPGVLVMGLALTALIPTVRAGLLTALLGGASAAARLVNPAPLSFEPEAVDCALSTKVVAVGAISSLAAWGLMCAGLVLLGAAGGVGAGWLDRGSAAALSILIGGLSLLPLGVGVSGFVLLDQLGTADGAATTAAEVVFVYRVATVWFSVALGGVTLLAGRRFLRGFAPARRHFDSIDPCYDSWLPPHYRNHVVGKKIAPMQDHLARLGSSPLGLDIGCGRGWYLNAVRSLGARAVGIDLSRRQLAAASEYAGPERMLSQASVIDLPFRSRAYDFAYTVNVIHHLASRSEQRQAFDEIARVLRPGGLLFLHEMNIRNPLFRWYLSYLFPILKGIDEGIEHFLDPRHLPSGPSLRVVSVDYFTFTPDLTPAPLLPILSALERRLEASRLAHLGVHFLAVLERCDDDENPLPNALTRPG